MFGTHDFIFFITAGITLNLLPGPDTLYIIGRSVAQGRNAGFLSVLGISTGCLVHTTVAALGLSAILVASAFAFGVVKWAGAAYLVYLGIQMLVSRDSGANVDMGKMNGADLWTIYRARDPYQSAGPEGWRCSSMAFLPHFVARDHASSPLPFLFLGSVFIFTGTLVVLVSGCKNIGIENDVLGGEVEPVPPGCHRRVCRSRSCARRCRPGPASSNAITTTAAPCRRAILASWMNFSSPSFIEIEFTTGLPWTHFRPASMTPVLPHQAHALTADGRRHSFIPRLVPP